MNLFDNVDDKTAKVLILLHALFTALIVIFSEGTYDTGDGILHHQISRYSWQNPELLLDHWGKPFFTLISSPFSQFGLTGTAIFNILCASFSAWFAFLIVKRLKLNFAVLVIPFLFFTPIYFPTLNSGLTEPFFGLTLVLSLYLILDQKFAAGALLMSFLPFVRSEGFLIIPFAALFLLLHRRWLTIPLFGAGTAVYSLAGYFYYKDLLWLKNQNPYSLGNEVYGNGELLHYFEKYDELLGPVLAVLFLAGIAAMIYQSSERNQEKMVTKEKLLLIYGPAIVYVFAHIIFWWKGIYGSLGLTRVLAAVIPLTAVVCLDGLNFIVSPLKKGTLKIVIVVLILLIIMINPFTQLYFPFKTEPEAVVVREAAQWLKENKKIEEIPSIYYLHPYLPFVLNKNIFDESNLKTFWLLNSDNIEEEVEDGNIIFWDSHFGPNEGRIKLEKLLGNPSFRLINSFIPPKEIYTLGGHSYQVLLFEKIREADPEKEYKKITKFYDFEQEDSPDVQLVSTRKAYSGTNSLFIKKETEFAATKTLNCIAIAEEKPWQLDQRLKLYSPKGISDVFLVTVIEKNNSAILYRAEEINLAPSEEWEQFEVNHQINPGFYEKGDVIKVYIWNKGQKEFFVDDLSLEWH